MQKSRKGEKMNYIRKAAVCISFLLLLFPVACGREDKTDAVTENDSAAQGTEAVNTDVEEESATQDADVLDIAATDENPEALEAPEAVEAPETLEVPEASEGLGDLENTENTESASEQSPSDEETKQSPESDENIYKSILLGESNFICRDLDNKSLNIREIGQAVTYTDSDTVSVERFAVIDLDGDGEDEVVLELDCYGGGFVILHYQNGEVYAFEQCYRGFKGLKEDGTFMASDSAVHTCIEKLVFSDTGYSDIVLAELYWDFEEKPWHKINGEPCSDEELIAAVWSRQEQKPDAQWYDLSAENINAVFE